MDPQKKATFKAQRKNILKQQRIKRENEVVEGGGGEGLSEESDEEEM
jgi:hypothetical protein